MPKEHFSLVGIYGGTFDPVHYGHLRIAEELNEMLGFSELYFVPSGLPRLRNEPSASRNHRVAMLAAAIENNETFILDEREIEREGESYSVATLRELREEIKSECALCFIMGSDVFLNLPKWYRWRELFELCHIIVADRPGYLLALNNDMSEELSKTFMSRHAATIKELKESAHGHIFVAPTTLQDISATRIRKSIAAGKSVRYLTPDAVLKYIEINRLYLRIE